MNVAEAPQELVTQMTGRSQNHPWSQRPRTGTAPALRCRAQKLVAVVGLASLTLQLLKTGQGSDLKPLGEVLGQGLQAMGLRAAGAKDCVLGPLPEPWAPPRAPLHLSPSCPHQPSEVTTRGGQAPGLHGSKGHLPSTDTSLNIYRVCSFLFFLYIGL